jgi:hypothetical protein
MTTMNWKAFTALFIIGAAILFAGYAVDLYTNSVISGLQTQLQQIGLTTAQTNSLQGSLSWWQLHKITDYEPWSQILDFIGFVVIVFSLIYAVLAIWRETPNHSKTGKIENAPVNEEPNEPQTPQKTRTVHTTGFPIAAGILTIIAASLTIVNALLLVIQIGNFSSIIYYFEHNLPFLVFALFVGIWNFVAFGLGLTGGIFSIKRKHFTLSIVGISFLIVSGVFSLLGTGLSGWWMMIGIPVIILGILSVIFIGVSKNEFI